MSWPPVPPSGPPGATLRSTTLGVCIPTYKRPDQLLACVRSIVEAAAPHGVPIFISDDAGDDTNAEAIAQIRRLYAHVVYERNPRNLGIDRNILKSADMCTCDYAWLIGEDDRMQPTAIGTALAVIRRERPAFVYANYAAVNDDVSVVLRERSLPIRTDARRGSAEFLRSEAWSMGFIGACVVNVALWRGVARERYLDTYYAHVGTIMESLAGRDVYLIAEPQVLNRSGSPRVFTWSQHTFAVIEGWRRAMNALRAVYGAEACDEAAAAFESAHRYNTLRFLCYARAGGAYGKPAYEAYIRGAPRPAPYKLAAWLVARIDRRLFSALKAGVDAARRLGRVHTTRPVAGR